MTPSTCSYEGCTRPIHNTDEGKCIFHCEKKDPQEFRNALARQIRQWRKERATEWDFGGWVFVDTEPEHKSLWYRYNLFRHATFPVPASFESATFSGYASFESATFSRIAYFHSATFSGDAFFESATFKGYVFFGSATFKGDANFGNSTFARNANFRSATFCSTLDMSYACFAILGDFTEVIIGGKVRFTWPGVGHARQEKEQERKRGRVLLKDLKFEKKGNEGPLLNLRGNILQEDCKLLIHDTKMERVLLEGTDCRLIEFYNVSWEEAKERGHAKRRIVGDEYYLRYNLGAFGDDKPSWNEIAVTYQQLADRFRKDLDHPTANDFERGIFEARLEAAKAKKDWRNCFLLGAYKFASDFSGSILRPVLWTLLLTAIAAVIYGGILYDGFCNVSLWPGFDIIFQSIVAALRVVSLDRHWFSTAVDEANLSDLARFLLSATAVLQTLLTATLITLFIFSVRRRFKHSE